MLIGMTDSMTDQAVAELADWADYHAKDLTNVKWKRAYALIREGADLLLRRRAGYLNDPAVPSRTFDMKEALTAIREAQNKTKSASPTIELAGYEERRDPTRKAFALPFRYKRSTDKKANKPECEQCFNEEASFKCIRVAHRKISGTNSTGPGA